MKLATERIQSSPVNLILIAQNIFKPEIRFKKNPSQIISILNTDIIEYQNY